MYGEAIRKARKAAGKDIDSISNATRIHRTVVESLENEALDKLPEGVYVRGYLQQLGKELGLGAEEIARLIEDFNQSSGLNPPRIQIPADDAQQQNNSPFSKAVVGGGGAVIVLGFLLAMFLLRTTPEPEKGALPQPKPQPPSAQTAAEPAPHPPSTPPREPANPTPTAEPTPQPETVEETPPPQPTPAPERPPTPPEPSSPSLETTQPVPAPENPEETQPETKEEMTQDSIEEAVVAPERLELRLEATERAWIGWTIDEEGVGEALLEPGESVLLDAEEKIELKSGNAGGLQLTLNGHKLPPLGRSGQVRTKIFDHGLLKTLLNEEP